MFLRLAETCWRRSCLSSLVSGLHPQPPVVCHVVDAILFYLNGSGPYFGKIKTLSAPPFDLGIPVLLFAES